MIKVAVGVTLPVDVVTQAIGVIAKRRAGKSYTARRLVEQLAHAAQQVVIVDPKGDWWGIRSSADGQRPGFPFLTIGGERGDVPLEASAGEVVAKLLVEERVSALLDLSLLRKHEIATFMAMFLEAFYRLKAREQYRTPVMLVIDEADAVAPQKPQPNEARMLGAAEDIVRRGGQRGIGCTLITQRSAVLSKNVLTQVQMIIALRTIAPQDLKALDAWVEVHGTAKQRDTLMESLPALEIGEAWFWSPGWPTTDGLFRRARVLDIETFDSGATPRPGEKRVEPKSVADVDLDAVRQQMAETIERAKADDPKVLRAEIVKLRKELAAKTIVSPPETKVVEVPVVHTRDVEKIDAVVNRLSDLQQRLGNGLADLQDWIDELVAVLAKIPASKANGTEVHRNAERMRAGVIPVEEHAELGTIVELRKTEGVSAPQQRMLDALLSFESLHQPELTRSNLAVFSDQSPRSSGFERNLSVLRSGGFIEYPSSSMISLTGKGRAVANASAVPCTLDALHRAWFAKMSRPQQRMVDCLIDFYPKAITREHLAERSQQSPTSSGFERNLSVLRSLGVIDYPERGNVAATELLFPSGLA